MHLPLSLVLGSFSVLTLPVPVHSRDLVPRGPLFIPKPKFPDAAAPDVPKAGYDPPAAPIRFTPDAASAIAPDPTAPVTVTDPEGPIQMDASGRLYGVTTVVTPDPGDPITFESFSAPASAPTVTKEAPDVPDVPGPTSARLTTTSLTTTTDPTVPTTVTQVASTPNFDFTGAGASALNDVVDGVWVGAVPFLVMMIMVIWL